MYVKDFAGKRGSLKIEDFAERLSRRDKIVILGITIHSG